MIMTKNYTYIDFNLIQLICLYLDYYIKGIDFDLLIKNVLKIKNYNPTTTYKRN